MKPEVRSIHTGNIRMWTNRVDTPVHNLAPA